MSTAFLLSKTMEKPIDTSAIPRGIFTLTKYESEQCLKDKKFLEQISFGNAYTNAGGQYILDAITGVYGTPFNNANTFMGIGTSATATVATMVDLQATVGAKLRKGMDAGFPSRTAQVLTFRATFGILEANFSWQEIAIFNGSASSAVMLARRSYDMGVKVLNAIWTMDYTLTIPQ